MFASRKTWALACASILSLTAASGAAASSPPSQQEALRDYAIPGGALAPALNRFANETGMALVYPSSLADGRRTAGVRGSLSRHDALAQLLAGTGLTFRVTDGRTVTIEQAPSAGVEADGSRVLGPVRVEGAQSSAGVFEARSRGDGVAQLGGVRGAQDDEAIGYRARVATAGTGAPTALEDLPRTVTVVTQDQMAAQDIRTVRDVLDRLPGLTVIDTPEGLNDPTRSSQIYVRGFALDRIQVDGGVSRDLSLNSPGLLNLDAYERVELVHGANAVHTGEGSPGGALNLVRKRPGPAEALDVVANVGSWGRHGVQLDYSTPGLSGTPLAFRGVASFNEEGAHYDTYDKLDATLYGIVDAPLGDKARLELGALFNHVEVNGGYSGIRHYVDGPLFDVPRDWNATPDFAYSDLRSVEVFGRVYMEVLENVDFELGVSYEDREVSGLSVGISDTLLSTGGDFGPSRFDVSSSYRNPVQLGLDMKLTGQATTFGLKHDFYIAGSLNQNDDAALSLFLGSGSAGSVEEYTHVQYPPFAEPRSDVFSETRLTQSSFVIGDVISWRDFVELNLILRRDVVDIVNQGYAIRRSNGRLTNLTSSNWSQREQEGDEWIPTWSVTLKPSDNLSVYFSSSSGFSRQDDVFSISGSGADAVFTPLEPVEYDNLELGLKYGRDRWLATVAYYQYTESNTREFTGVFACPPTVGAGGYVDACYRTSDIEVQTRGVDLSLVGEIYDGLNVVANYNWFDSETNDPLGTRTDLPENTAQLLVDWRPAFLPDWTFRANLAHRSETYITGTRDFFGPPPLLEYLGSTPVNYTAGSYVVADLGATYRFSDRLSLDLYVENIFDEAYAKTVSQSYDFPGNPRSFNLTLRWRDVGVLPVDGRSPTNGLAPFGRPADWYGAFDYGLQSSKDMDARAEGLASDGATPVIWTFEMDEQQLISTRLGYRLGPDWRTELEVAHRANAFSDIGGGTVAPFGVCRADQAMLGEPFDCDAATGGLRAWSLLFNVIHDFGRDEAALRPFLGLGLGVTRATTEFDGKMEGIGPDTTPWGLNRFNQGIISKGTDLAATWQVQAGAAWRITPQATLDLTYKYFAAPELTWGSYNLDVPYSSPALAPILTPRLGDFTGDFENHSLNLGLRWAFGAP